MKIQAWITINSQTVERLIIMMAVSFTTVVFQSFFQDYLMALFVLCLAIIDIVILLLYTVTEAVRGNLGAKLTPNRELPEETIGVSYTVYSVCVCLCECVF